MTPTTRLRFVEREIETRRYSDYGDHVATARVRVLQQWWEDEDSSRFDPVGEWRDVPLEEEK